MLGRNRSDEPDSQFDSFTTEIPDWLLERDPDDCADDDCSHDSARAILVSDLLECEGPWRTDFYMNRGH